MTFTRTLRTGRRAESGENDLLVPFHVYLVGPAARRAMQNTDAGEIFIFTDPSYPGLSSQLSARAEQQSSVLNSFGLGAVFLQAGKYGRHRGEAPRA